MRGKIFILYTGGTIGMAPENLKDPQSPLLPKSWEEIQKWAPLFHENGYFEDTLKLSLTYKSLDEIKDSSQLGVNDWQLIAGHIHENYAGYDGFVVVHGTDTMAFTASALSFMLGGLKKPIVFTGSQLPISHPRTDAITNLSNAVHIAASKVLEMPTVPEISIAFNDKLHRGNRCTKYSTRDFKAFDSPNYPALASLDERIVIHEKMILEEPEEKFSLNANLNRQILDLAIFPGLTANYLGKIILQDDVEGLILRTYGSGNVPCTPDFIKVLSESQNYGTHIMFVSQCHHGGVSLGRYAPSKKFLDIGVISGGDMTHESALTKMMWVMGNFKKPEKIRLQLESNLCGERTY